MGAKQPEQQHDQQQQQQQQQQRRRRRETQPPPPPPPKQQPQQHQRTRPPAVASALSGALSGAIISACVQPLDVLRTRMQADAALGHGRGVLQTLRVVLGEGGVRGLWRGTGPTVLRLSLGAGINFVALERLKHLALDALVADEEGEGAPSSGQRQPQPQRQPQQLGYLQAAAVGGLARAVSAAAMSPVTLVKTRMEYGGPGHTRYASTFAALASIARAEGPRGLFRGLWPTVLTNAPFSALYYALYTRLKGALGAAAEGAGVPAAAVTFVSGVAAATAATLLTQPSDVVRTRVQLGLPGAAAPAAGGALGTLAAVARAGPGALLAGAAPRVLKRTLQTALVWTLYEELVPRASLMYNALAAAQRDADGEEAAAAADGGAAGRGGRR